MLRPFALAVSLALALTTLVQADPDSDRARDDKISELERKLETVVNELEAVRAQSAVPETDDELKSRWGLGPGASKVYSLAKGVSIGGYAEGGYHRSSESADEWDLTRAVLYVGYKFSERLVWNSEIEFEHASTEREGSVSVEFAALDFLYRPELNFRVGKLLLPVGFVNQMHEPPFYYGTQRPGPERFIIPSTWGENGVGIFGDLSENLHYKVYVVAGLDASAFDVEKGIREGRQAGSESLAEDLGWIGNLEYDVLPGLRVGGSYFSGGADQDQKIDVGGTEFALPNVRTSLWEAHGEWRYRGLVSRLLWTQVRISDAGRLSNLLSDARGETVSIAHRLQGGYAELAYDLMPIFSPGSEASLEPFVRVESIDMQSSVPEGFPVFRAARRRVYISGVQWKPIPNVVLKLDYRNTEVFGERTNGDEVSFGFGLVF